MKPATLNLLRIQQLKHFLDIWRLMQQMISPQLHPLEIAIACEELAAQIRREETQKQENHDSDN